MKKQLYEAECMGFCGGVRLAIEIFDKIVAEHKTTVYVLHELVHNTVVSKNIIDKGGVFVDSLSEVPNNSIVLFGAHGVAKSVVEEAKERNLQYYDATCPLVKKLQDKAANLGPKDNLVIFGNPKHPEVCGVAGHSNAGNTYIVNSASEIDLLPQLDKPILLCQTTREHQEIDAVSSALKQRFPDCDCQSGVCNAVYKRQLAVEKLAQLTKLIIVLGSPHSSNAARLAQIAQKCGAKSFLINSKFDLPQEELKSAQSVGIAAGTSTPDEVINEVRNELIQLNFEK